MSARWLHRLFWVVGFLPAALLLVNFELDRLSANPIEDITHVTGEWAIRWLLFALAVTPLRRLFGWNRLAPYRRSAGLLAFFYASLHFLTYFALDLYFDLDAIIEDIVERPYVTVGFTAFMMLLPLAITSTRGWIQRLGKNWVKLHRLAYAAGIAAVIHYLWLVKADLLAPIIHAMILACLLGVRIYLRVRKPS